MNIIKQSLLGHEKKIGCTWSSKVGKVVGWFIVKPVQEQSENQYGKIGYICQFIKLEFIRIYGGEKYTEISELPDDLKHEVEILLGSKKYIARTVLENNTVVYTERPEEDELG